MDTEGTFSLGELAGIVGGSVIGDASIRIHGLNGIREARAGEITFLANPRYTRYLNTTRASAVIMRGGEGRPGLAILSCADPYAAFLRILEHFAAAGRRVEAGIHPTSVIASGAILGTDVAVGPHVVVEEGARIGDGCVVMAGSFVGRDAHVGSGCVFYPHVVVHEETRIGDRVLIHSGAVIGDDGFGFYPQGDGFRKIPHIGRVVIEDDVEIGANATIDRATVGETRIRKGTRIDNLVMIAHNVSIGKNSILCGQVGISGSTEIGSGVTLAGQAGVVGHINIGDGAKVGAQGGVTKSIPAHTEVSGYPAMPHGAARRVYASMRHLPEALQKIRDLTARLEELERKVGE